MYIEWWHAIMFAIATGLWAEWRHRVGVKEGTVATLVVLEEKEYVKFNKSGKLVKHPG
jgi:hypothetical protein